MSIVFRFQHYHARKKLIQIENRPESAIHGRNIRPHQYLNHSKYPFVNWGSLYLTDIPAITFIVGYTVFLDLFAPIHQSTLLDDFCGRQLNICQLTSSNIYLLSTNVDKLFSLLSSSNTMSNCTPIINTRAPLSTPSILTKHLKSIPNNMVKKDFVYHRHDKENNKTTNRKKLSLPTEARSRLYELAKLEMRMDEDDLHRSHDGLAIPEGHKALLITRAHDPLKHLKHYLKNHTTWYIFPQNDKRNQPDHVYSSKVCSHSLKAAYNQLRRDNQDFHMSGWWTMESWERHTMARNHLPFAAGPLIDWKWDVDKVVVHHGVAPMMSSLHAFQLRKGNIPERAYVSIHINTHHKANDPIEFFDYWRDGFAVQWALNQLSIPKNIRDLETAIRFDVRRDVLQHSYEERFTIHTQAGKLTAKQPDERLMTNVRGFQKFLNRPLQEDIPLNSQAAAFPVRGGSIMKSPQEGHLRFEWTLLTTCAKLLFKMVMDHEWTSNGSLFAIKVSHLEQSNILQLQASREQLKDRPEMDAPETWCTIMRSGYGKSPYTIVEVCSLRSTNSLLAKLDVLHVPCDNGRNPLQSFAWNLFHNDGIVLFYGSEAQLVRFWASSTTTETKHQDNTKPIAPHTWSEPPTQCSFEVGTPGNERELHAKVVAALFGPFKNWRRTVDPAYNGHVHPAEYQSEDSAALAHQYSMSGSTIVCANPIQINQTALMQDVEPQAPLHQRHVMAGMAMGSKVFVAEIIEADERLHQAPLTTDHDP